MTATPAIVGWKLCEQRPNKAIHHSQSNVMTDKPDDQMSPIQAPRKQRYTLERTSAVIETLKNVVEIGALIIAALWAYSRFNLGEKPSLAPRLELTTTLEWEKRANPQECFAIFGATLKNIGKVSFTVEDYRIRAWRLPISQVTGLMRDGTAHLSFPLLDDVQTVFDSTYKDVGLAQRYGPDEGALITEVFLMRTARDTIGVFEVMASYNGERGDSLRYRGANNWYHICGDLPDTVAVDRG